MGVIWIKCPATGRKASTGIESDAISLARFPGQLDGLRCPICRMRHALFSDEAWLVEERGAEMLRKAS